jgi:hypothetical protein
MEPRLNVRKLSTYLWSIFSTDVAELPLEMPLENFRAMLTALSVVTGKGVISSDESLSILGDSWERFGAHESQDSAVSRAAHRMLVELVIEPWSTLTISAVHGVVLAALVVLSKGRVELSSLRQSYQNTWNAYEIPEQLLSR